MQCRRCRAYHAQQSPSPATSACGQRAALMHKHYHRSCAPQKADPAARLVSQCCTASRRQSLLAGLCSIGTLATMPAQAVPEQERLSADALRAFKSALATQDDFQAQDAAWSRVIELAPRNSIAWSNRGAIRLQNNQWTDAESDLRKSVALEAGFVESDRSALMDLRRLEPVDSSTLNNLGNVEVALGRLDEARVHFQAASRDPALRSIALQNMALTAFEGGDNELAIRITRQNLRKDPAFLDARAALVAFLYASGNTAEAEEQFDQLQEADDGIGGALYNRRTAVARVQNRWPPRATAALDAFLTLSSTGTALGYDLQSKTFKFNGTV